MTSRLSARLVEAIILATQEIKKPTAKTVITRITKELHAATISKAQYQLPAFFNQHLDDSNVIAITKIRDQAKLIAGSVVKISSWDDAWGWLLHASELLATSSSRPRGVDEVFAHVFHHVHREGISETWVDVIAFGLGYDSVEEANAEALGLNPHS